MYSLYIPQISCQTHLIYNKKIGKLQVGTAGGKKMQGHSPLLKHLLAHTIVNLEVKLFQFHLQADSRHVRVRQGSLPCYTNE